MEVLRAPQEGGCRQHPALRHAAHPGARRQARRGQDPGHVARLRQRRQRRRPALSVPVPDRRHLLVAGRRGGEVRQGQARRQSQGQEDRLPVLRQPGRQGAAADPRGPRQARGLRAEDLRRAGARRRDGRPGARHHPALPCRLRDRPPVRPLAVGVDQGVQAGRLPAVEGRELRLGLGRGRSRGGWRRCGRRGLQHHAVRGRRQRLPGAQGNPRHVPRSRASRRPRRWRRLSTTTAASST